MRFLSPNITGRERKIHDIPQWVVPFLLIALVLQAFWHHSQPSLVAKVSDLKPPPSTQTLQLFSLGDPVVFAKLNMLWLQAHDNQPGVSIPFRQLEYGVLIQWLETILSLDPRSHYPLLSAVRVFAEVPVPDKQRQMLAFVEREFYKDPNHRWQWMTHAVFVAKHRLKDEQLALQFAQGLAEKATGNNVPSWAKQMQIFLLEDMGEVETAKILLGALLESGQVIDENERSFLYRRLEELAQK